MARRGEAGARTSQPVGAHIREKELVHDISPRSVKHVRGRRGRDGDLALYDDALVYESPEAGASRYWRFGDLASVYAPDRFRLEVLTYEGGGGETRPFTFQLKTDLPPGFFDRLWASVNTPAPLRPAVAGR